MFKDLNWVRLTPDRPGRGGMKSGIHSFQQEPINDVNYVNNAHVYQGAWRRDFDTSRVTGTGVLNSAQAPNAVHGYVYPSLLNPAAQPSLTVLGTVTTQSDNTSRVWDYTAGANRATRAVNWTQPGVFNTVNQRCFFGDGSGEGMIFDDRTPAIHLQNNQNLGVAAPSQALSLYATTGFSPIGSGYCTKSSAYINSPNPNNLISTILTTDTVAAAPPNGSGPGSASGAVTVAGTSSNTAAFTATGTISITTGTSLVTLSGWTWPANGEYCGLAINFNGYSFVIAETNQSSNSWDIDGASIGLSATQLLIMGVYDGPTVTGVPYTITGARVKLTTAATQGGWSNSGTLGYAQLTNTNLVPVSVLATRSNGLYRNLGGISLGPAGGGTRATVTDGAMGAGGNDLTSASQPWLLTDAGKTIIVDGAASAPFVGDLLFTTINTFLNTGGVRLADTNGSGGAISGKRAWWGTGFTTIQDATMGAASTTLTSASNPFTNADVGKFIMVGKAGTAGVALYTSITAFVSAGQVTLANPSVGAVTNVRAAWGAGTAGATVGPTYAYAWYDPETGHMSNISPTFQIPKPTSLGSQYADFANLTPAFQVDPGYISYPSGVDATRFSHIVFFRTLSTGGSTLYPIGSLQPFVGKVHPGSASTRGSWNPTLLGGWAGIPNQWVSSTIGSGQVWYDFSSDADLILSGGFRAPQFTNGKPMATIRGGATQPAYPYAMAYWDRRLWIVSTQEPDKILFSCDDAQCPLGVPEESFPTTNFLRLPAVDGRVQGMKTLGDMLLITTDRWAYIIAGNNESNYRLMKVSSSMPGVGTYQMHEFPTYSGAEGEPATLFFLGRDRVIYKWIVGGQTIPISGPVQKTLDGQLGAGALSTYQRCRLHCVSAWGRRFVVFSSGTVYYCLLYDIDNQVWTYSNLTDSTGTVASPQAFTTIYGTGVPVDEAFTFFNGSNITVRSWVRDDTGLSSQPLFLGTFPLSFDGKKTRKQLVSVNLHASPGTYTLGGTINEDNGNAFSATFGAYPDPLDSIYGPLSPNPVEGAGTQDIVVMPGQFNTTSGAIPVGYRFTIGVSNATATPGSIYAIDLGYKVIEEPGDGDP